MNSTKKLTEVLDKALPSVEKITQAITINKERVSESCYLLNPLSKLCNDVIKYSIHKDVNVTKAEDNVKNFLNKLSRHSDLSASCLYSLRDFRCLLEFQKCSPEGKLLPVCSSVRVKAQECTTLVLDDSIIDTKRIEDKECFSGLLPLNNSSNSNIQPFLKAPDKPSSTALSVETEPSKTPTKDIQKAISSDTKTLECTRRSYLVRWNDTNCFSPKVPKPDKKPSINTESFSFGKIEFELNEDFKCIDTLNLLQAQVEQVCSCDTEISIARAPCGTSISSPESFNETKIVSFREVDYIPGLEKHLDFFNNSPSKNSFNDLHDPLYFERFYYRTCDRLTGIPEVYTEKNCDKNYNPSELKFYMGFKNSTVSKKFRTGCTYLECLAHLRYMPAVSSKPNITSESSKNDIATFNQDICLKKIPDCPVWDFDEVISIGGYPPKITSYLELDIQAFSNSTRPAIIFSFRALAQPLYEGMRFLLNGVPAMDMVYNQSSYKGYAVPLIPGKVHIARWEFVRGKDIGASSINFAGIQSIILRDSIIVDSIKSSQLQQNLNFKNNLVHVAPEAPGRVAPSNTLAENTNITASISAITVLFTLLTGISVSCILLWFWTQHKKSRKNEDSSSDSDTLQQDFYERDAQFSFIGMKDSNHGYAALSKKLSPDLELETFNVSESSTFLPDEE